MIRIFSGRCAPDVVAFQFMFMIVFMAYAQYGYLLFGPKIYDFSKIHYARSVFIVYIKRKHLFSLKLHLDESHAGRLRLLQLSTRPSLPWTFLLHLFVLLVRPAIGTALV